MEFEEKDIRTDDEARREQVEDLQSRATPTLVVGGRVLIGFDAGEYEGALETIN